MELGARIRELRNKRGLTQSQLGDMINVTKASISGYENGTRNPDKETLIKLADIFHVSTDYLLGRTEIKQAHVLTGKEEYDFTPEEEISAQKKMQEMIEDIKKEAEGDDDIDSDTLQLLLMSAENTARYLTMLEKEKELKKKTKIRRE